MAAANACSTTESNNQFILNCTGENVLEASASHVRAGLRLQEPLVTDDEIKTAGFLTKALEDRARLIANGHNITLITQQIHQASAGQSTIVSCHFITLWLFSGRNIKLCYCAGLA